MADTTCLASQSDWPLNDPTAYSMGPDDNITDTTEAAAVTHNQVVISGRTIAYTATRNVLREVRLRWLPPSRLGNQGCGPVGV